MRHKKTVKICASILVFVICMFNASHLFLGKGTAESSDGTDGAVDTIIWDTNQMLSTDYIVPQNKTLVIKPGITIDFSGAARVIVYGALSAIGNNTTSTNINGQITIQNGFCNISFCNVSYMECMDSMIWISNSTIENRIYSRTSNLFLQNAKIRGIYGFYSKIEVFNCSLYRNGTGQYPHSSFLPAEFHISRTSLTVTNSTFVSRIETGYCIFKIIDMAEVLIYNSTIGVVDKGFAISLGYNSRLIVSNTTVNGSMVCMEESTAIFRCCSISGVFTIYKNSNAYFYDTLLDRDKIVIGDYYSNAVVDGILIQNRDFGYYLVEYGYYVLAICILSSIISVLFMEFALRKKTVENARNLRKRYYASLFGWLGVGVCILSFLLSYVAISISLNYYIFVKRSVIATMPLLFSICGGFFSHVSFKIDAKKIGKMSLLFGILSFIVSFLVLVYLWINTVI